MAVKPKYNNTNMTQLLHFIINELKEYGLKFCKFFKYNYILFQRNEFVLTELNNDVFTNSDDLVMSEHLQHKKYNVNEFEILKQKYIKQSEKILIINE